MITTDYALPRLPDLLPPLPPIEEEEDERGKKAECYICQRKSGQLGSGRLATKRYERVLCHRNCYADYIGYQAWYTHYAAYLAGIVVAGICAICYLRSMEIVLATLLSMIIPVPLLIIRRQWLWDFIPAENLD